MKLITIIPVLFTATVQAQVYKCELETGGILYQDTECKGKEKQFEVTIEKFDENKIRQAQEKLAEELKKRDEKEKAIAEAENRERELRALEQIGRAREEMVNATRNQTNAIDRNTEAVQSRSYGYRPYYYRRSKKRPGKHHEKKIKRPDRLH